MPPLFWLDISILCVTIVVTFALTLIAVGFGPREPLNRAFAAFTFALGASTFCAICARISLWTGHGKPLLLMELSIPMYAATGPLLLVFSARYLHRRTFWIDRLAILGLALIILVAFPLFQGRLITNPRLLSNGTLLVDINRLGLLAVAIPSIFMVWSLVIYWEERHQTGEQYMASSAFILFAGLILGGALQIPFPIDTIANALSVLILAYGALSRQLFNPLRQRTLELQEQINERVKAEDALRNNEARLRSLLAAFPDLIITFGPQGQVYEMYSSGENWFGPSREDIVGKNIRDVLPPNAANRIFSMIEQALQSHTVLDYEYSMPDWKGDRRWYQARVVAYQDQGEPRVVWLSRNITERKLVAEMQEKATTELAQAYDATLEGWSRALELRERETAGHSQRVVQMTLRLAEVFGIKEEDLVHIRRGALLHDIGKLGIPDSILLKPGPLTKEEWEIMRQHPVYSNQLIESIPYLRPALEIPNYHHEWWDGSGYLRRLKGEDIPIAARIFAVVDVWDALISKRPYRPAWSEDQAAQYLREQAGKHFDPRVVQAFFEQGFQAGH